MESPPGSARSSPEAEVGMRVEDLWDLQEPQLTPTEKLNSCFCTVPVSSFPPAPSSQVVEIPSDSTLADAVETLSKNRILSAPVRNVEASDDASWIDRYIGVVEFAGIALEVVARETTTDSAAKKEVGADELAAKLGTVTLENKEAKMEGATFADEEAKHVVKSTRSEAASMGGSFLEALTSSECYKNTKVVRDIAGSFRWAPFLALQSSDSFLTMLLLLSKYRMKSLPVVDLGEGKIENIITQSAVLHMLAECVGLHWFEDWGTKKLFELGLPIMKPNRLIKVSEDEPILNAFQQMRRRGIGGVPVVDANRNKAIGSISIRDVQYLLTASEIYKDYRLITVKDFMMTVREHLENQKDSAAPISMITCRREETAKEIILRLDAAKQQRIYVVNEEEELEGVITLRDIISRLVHEPHGYFGDFFDGVFPLPENSRV
uniref:CBS domain-containing protein n=1 Tax=Ananas comosus var. bracteatus TaxID=296719 RepID=A0A6V7QT55_ANACO